MSTNILFDMPMREDMKTKDLTRRQISHVRAWRRHTASMIKVFWNEGVSLKEICGRLQVSEVFVDHVIRGNVCRDAGPPVTPRRSFGRNQKTRLREMVELPGE